MDSIIILGPKDAQECNIVFADEPIPYPIPRDVRGYAHFHAAKVSEPRPDKRRKKGKERGAAGTRTFPKNAPHKDDPARPKVK